MLLSITVSSSIAKRSGTTARRLLQRSSSHRHLHRHYPGSPISPLNADTPTIHPIQSLSNHALFVRSRLISRSSRLSPSRGTKLVDQDFDQESIDRESSTMIYVPADTPHDCSSRNSWAFLILYTSTSKHGSASTLWPLRKRGEQTVLLQLSSSP